MFGTTRRTYQRASRVLLQRCHIQPRFTHHTFIVEQAELMTVTAQGAYPRFLLRSGEKTVMAS